VAIEKWLADDGYLEWIGTHTDLFETAPSDQLSKVVSSSLTPEPKRFYTVLSAAAVAGKQAEAMAYGVRAQQFVAEATCLPNAFLSGVYGAFGTVAWITGADSMSDLDAVVDMQMTNTDFHELVNEAGSLFLPGSGMGGLIEKIN